MGFGTHPHRDMEIVSYVLEGALEHKDSMGNGSIIRPGEVQRMSAGTGVTHSEHNPSPDGLVHFLQIWILPEKIGLPPSYEQVTFPQSERQDRLRLVASRDGREGSVTIHQDADLYASLLRPQSTLTHTLRPGRYAWVQVARGEVTLDGKRLGAGDGAAISGEATVRLGAETPSEILLFDLP
jgi:redox-sensitive bicupin YhaK (pirin superfamily)